MSNQKKLCPRVICIAKKVVGNDVCDQNRLRITLPPTKKVVHNQNKFCVTMCTAKKVVRNGLCNQKKSVNIIAPSLKKVVHNNIAHNQKVSAVCFETGHSYGKLFTLLII